MRRVTVVLSKNSRALLLRRFGLFFLAVLILAVLTVSAFAVGAIRGEKTADATPEQSGKTVIIDAGHGGFDGGAVVNGVMEKDINLIIANRLSDMLRAAGFRVITTRTDDTSTESDPSATVSARKRSDLANRLAVAKQNPDAILVSIHLNKFSSASAKGAQMFCAPKTEGSESLAEAIRANVVSLLQKDNTRSVKKGTRDTYLLYYSPIPAVIVECGFMSNPAELAQLRDDHYQTQMAFAVFCGILQYYNE